MGGLQGVFADVKASELGAAAIREAVARAGAPRIDQTIMGCVLSAGQGQAPARQAAKGAGLADDVPATTINKMCGSGMQAAMLAHDMLKARQRRLHRRGRDGEHDQRAISAGAASQGRALRP